jgi:Xaa-Pro aminopeptidase
MILSNEPGYYKTGHYGIRIENLVLVAEAPAAPGAEKPLNRFETLSLVPIDRRLIDVDGLSREEIDWVDAYHAEVRETLAPELTAETAEWLVAATAPLRRD